MVDRLGHIAIVEGGECHPEELQVRTQIKSMFDHYIEGGYTDEMKGNAINACVVSERDLMLGVDEDIVRMNFLRMLVKV